MNKNGQNRKNKLPEGKVNSKKPKQLEVGPDGLCVDDYLSNLPNLCLLEIFLHSTRADIFNMMTVNKKIYHLATDRSLDHIKWTGGTLIIKHTKHGYGYDFTIEHPRSKNYPWKRSFYPRHSNSYIYEITQTDDGIFIEEKRINGILKNKDRAHNWPIPGHFFHALSDILDTHEATIVVLDEIQLNASFFTQLEKALGGHYIDEIRCIRLVFENDEDFIPLAKTVKQVNLESSPHSTFLINADYIKAVGESKHREQSFIAVDKDTSMAHGYRFDLPESYLQYLVHYESLSVCSMLINVNWVANLLMMRMDVMKSRPKKDLHWHFAVDQLITAQIIQNQPLGAS